MVECLPNCRAEGEKARYAPITVEQAVLNGYADSYGRAERFKKDAAAKTDTVATAKEVAVA